MNKSSIIKFIFIFQLVLSSSICIYFSSIEYIKLPEMNIDFGDKLLHFLAFAIYGLSLQIAIVPACKSQNRLQKILILISGAIFAMSDEIHQMFVPGRSADILDWIVDVGGVTVSLLFFNSISKLTHSILNNKKIKKNS